MPIEDRDRGISGRLAIFDEILKLRQVQDAEDHPRDCPVRCEDRRRDDDQRLRWRDLRRQHVGDREPSSPNDVLEEFTIRDLQRRRVGFAWRFSLVDRALEIGDPEHQQPWVNPSKLLQQLLLARAIA